MGFVTLMYHEIREKASHHPEHPSAIDVKQDYKDILPPPLFVTLENFEDQMTYLKENNFHTLSLKEVRDFYYDHKNIPDRSVLLTFDDCYLSVKKYAYPILKKYGFHAVAFVVTGWLHEEPKPFDPDQSVCMAESDLKDISDVFEFANHTYLFHTRSEETTSKLMTASDDEFAADLKECNKKAYITGKDAFAYPFGFFVERNVHLLRKEGFRLAFTSDPGVNDKNTDPLLLYRNAVPYFVSINEFMETVG